jgi:hypothetical protein
MQCFMGFGFHSVVGVLLRKSSLLTLVTVLSAWGLASLCSLEYCTDAPGTTDTVLYISVSQPPGRGPLIKKEITRPWSHKG